MKRCHSLAFEAAGHNPIEKAQVRVDIESKSVGRNPARHMNSHRDELIIPDPNSARTVNSSGIYSKFSGHANKDLFERVHIPGEVPPVLGEVKYGIADKLATSVESDIASPVGFKYLGAKMAQALWRKENVFAIGVTPQRVNRRMFQQKEGVGNIASLSRNNSLMLEEEAVLVIDNAR